MSWLLLILQVFLSAMFLVAATAKMLHADEFVAAARLSHLPAGSIAPIGVAIPAIEVTLALALLLAPARWLPLVFLAATLLLGTFLAWMEWVRERRLRVRCGCFGPAGGEVGPRTIGRSLVLLALALAGLALARQARTPLPVPSLTMVVTVTSLGACLALLLALRNAWPHLMLSAAHVHARQAGTADGE
jgi:hypothetical protein